MEPGFGGQKFMPSAVDKIAAIRAEALRRGLELEIEVDGGIGEATAPLCTRAGATVLVAGSAVFCAKDPAAAIDVYKRQAHPTPTGKVVWSTARKSAWAPAAMSWSPFAEFLHGPCFGDRVF